MKRREFITLLGGAAAAWPIAARAQQVGRLPTIGFLVTGTPSSHGQWFAALVQRLHELGWIEGRTVAIEYRWAEGRTERFDEIAAEFVRRKVDVIVTSSTAAIVAAKRATSVIPIVFAANTHRVRINTLALAERLPTMHFTREGVEGGGLMSYGPNFPDLFRRAANFVDKILRGAKPGDIPVEQPTKFDLIINLTTAKALRLDVPSTLLARADEVIE
jgi:ABC-type uncharacterized transport system substrate-binding protein